MEIDFQKIRQSWCIIIIIKIALSSANRPSTPPNFSYSKSFIQIKKAVARMREREPILTGTAELSCIPLTPAASIFINKTLWVTSSKAFLKLMKRPVDLFSAFILLLITSVTFMRAYFVDLSCLKPKQMLLKELMC